MQRRLSAIMSVDVAGYSALMAADEEGTLARLKMLREESIEPSIAARGGRVVKLMGDGLLVEFASVVEAVRAGVEIQRDFAERNADEAAEQRIVLRIGINQGDVIIDGDDIYGDDVNIAARLQERAAPGGICISERVFSDIRGKLDVAMDDLGDQELKNIPDPVRVYRVLLGPDGGNVGETSLRQRFAWPRLLIFAVSAVLVIIVAGTVVWYGMWPKGPDDSRLLGSAKASIAVLPFANLNRDPKEDFFADGITNDIISDLSKFQNLRVIAGNSVAAYKGKTVDARDVSRDLGVGYVLVGSVLKRGNRVRMNVQLIDGIRGQNLWAERYDEAAEDIWDIEDAITGRIVRTLAVRITEIEHQRVLAKSTDNLAAYEYVLRGQALLARQSRGENFEARKLFRQAVEIDPNYAAAYAGLGWTFYEPVLWGWTGTPQESMNRAYDLAQKALTLDATDVYARRLLASIYGLRRQHDLALVESERLIAINPNDAGSYAQQGIALTWLGQPAGAIRALERALRFDPDMRPNIFWHLGLAYYLQQRYTESATVLQRNIGRRKDPFWDYLLLAAVYAQMGKAKEAAQAAETVRRIDPRYERLIRFSQFEHDADVERVSEGLRKAGLQ
jgi:TolB-like protein/class 3 adenylate cyclase/cytochrome c-type biogenesis protein CcmH/NrfG